MIIDNIENAANYFDLHPLFEKAFEYVKSLNTNELQEGVVEIDGAYLKAIITKSCLRDKESAKLETHRKYIDIQIPISTSETFGWRSLASLQNAEGTYDADNDILFFSDTPSTYLTAMPGEFVIFSPEDGHAPLIGKDEILKIILKVALI